MNIIIAVLTLLASICCLFDAIGIWSLPGLRDIPDHQLIAAILFVGFSVETMGYRILAELEDKCSESSNTP